jgi:hypothetical protein
MKFVYEILDGISEVPTSHAKWKADKNITGM